jgi:hypothetical protein
MGRWDLSFSQFCWPVLILVPKIDFLLCRKWSQTQVKDYTNLNDLLFDADEKQVGRLADNTEEITVGSFFCDILKVKEIPKQHNQLIEEHLNNTSRFSEPLL